METQIRGDGRCRSPPPQSTGDRFLTRLKILTETAFNGDAIGTKIDAVRAGMEPEVRLSAETFRQDPDDAVRDFHTTMNVFTEHLELRRAFVIQKLEKG